MKYKVGDRVRVNGWTRSAIGRIVSVHPQIYHRRMYEYVVGYGIEYEPGESNGLALNPVPEGYITEVLE